MLFKTTDQSTTNQLNAHAIYNWRNLLIIDIDCSHPAIYYSRQLLTKCGTRKVLLAFSYVLLTFQVISTLRCKRFIRVAKMASDCYGNNCIEIAVGFDCVVSY